MPYIIQKSDKRKIIRLGIDTISITFVWLAPLILLYLYTNSIAQSIIIFALIIIWSGTVNNLYNWYSKKYPREE